MWWVNKFGSVSGPYSDDQIRKGVEYHQFTKLHKISSDRQNWRRMDQTEFWKPASSVPEPIDIPLEFGGGKIGSIAKQPVMPPPPTPAVEQSKEIQTKQDAEIHRQTFREFVDSPKFWLCIVGVLAMLVITVLLFALNVSKEKQHAKEAVKTEQRMPIPSTVPVATNVVDVVGASNKVSAADFDMVKRRVLIVRTENGSGTAFLVKMDGKKYVMTNDHVIRSKTVPEMSLPDGTKVRLGALSVAKDRDLARFETDYDGEYFEFDDNVPNNNDEIWIYGNSKGDGVITTLRGFITGVGPDVIKVSAEIVGGNSGSPILAKDGKVLAVAAYLLNGDDGRDWTTRDTSFDGVRRFGIRACDVGWVKVDRKNYAQSYAKLELMDVYWRYLVPYLICNDVSDKEYRKLKLEHKDFDRKSLGQDGEEFHEMLMDLSKSYAGQGSSLKRWKNLLLERDALIKKLNKAIDSEEITLENGKKALKEWDAKKKITATWEKVKAKYRDFNAQKDKALNMAKEFLEDADWQNPLMRHGCGDVFKRNTVDWYLEGIQYFLDKNEQDLQDLNKELRKLENGDDDDDE